MSFENPYHYPTPPLNHAVVSSDCLAIIRTSYGPVSDLSRLFKMENLQLFHITTMCYIYLLVIYDVVSIKKNI